MPTRSKRISEIYCPKCRGVFLAVTDTRACEHPLFGVYTRRRRICRACDHRWTTMEVSLEHLKGIEKKIFDHMHEVLSAKIQEAFTNLQKLHKENEDD